MTRREFFSSTIVLLLPTQQRFRFTVRTKSKSIIHTTIGGRGVHEAEAKLRKRYPDCEILRVQEL